MNKIYLLLLLLFFSSASYAQEKENSTLFVFIGEKVEVKEFSPDVKKGTIIMDGAFKAKYKIIKNIHGNYPKDTIEFEAYDHYGVPAFSKYKHVLLYVSEQGGKLYHEKYQYSDVYLTKGNKWAGPYSSSDYEHPDNENTSIKPVRVKFKEEVSVDISEFKKEAIDRWFPSPYYKITGNKAIVVMGNYINELFQLKKDGILKARGYYFDN